jgi:hypothetical protein
MREIPALEPSKREQAFSEFEVQMKTQKNQRK